MIFVNFTPIFDLKYIFFSVKIHFFPPFLVTWPISTKLLNVLGKYEFKKNSHRSTIIFKPDSFSSAFLYDSCRAWMSSGPPGNPPRAPDPQLHRADRGASWGRALKCYSLTSNYRSVPSINYTKDS